MFFFPHIHKDIDFSKGFEFLEQELKEISRHSKTGKRHSDKLAKVHLNDGSEQWLLIHLEIQGYQQKNFPERMYIYNYMTIGEVNFFLHLNENNRIRIPSGDRWYGANSTGLTSAIAVLKAPWWFYLYGCA